MERMVSEVGAGLRGGNRSQRWEQGSAQDPPLQWGSSPPFAVEWMRRWTQESCLELSVLPANSCQGRKAGRHSASGIGAHGGRQGG